MDPIRVHPARDVSKPVSGRVVPVHGELVCGFVGGRGERVGSEDSLTFEGVVLGLEFLVLFVFFARCVCEVPTFPTFDFQVSLDAGEFVV